MFFFPHFKHLQKVDPLTGDTPGYQGRLVTLRYFIMYQDLKDCEKGKWKTREDFREYVSFLNELTEEEKESCMKKADHLFRIMKVF